MDFGWLLRVHADPDPDANTYPYTHANSYTDAYPDTNTNTNTDAHTRLRHLFGRHLVCIEPSRLQCRRLLSVYGSRLVFVDSIVVLCTGNRLGMDPGMDASDFGCLQRHSDAYSDAYSDPNTNTYADTDSNANANTDAKFRVQPVQGRHGQHQLEHGRNAKRSRRFDASHHYRHAFA